MFENSRVSSLQSLAFFSSFFFQFLLGFSKDTSAENGQKDDVKSNDGGIGTKVAIICLAVVAVVLFSFFLFKLWQKKKREEQYARLLKLFEEDDELEVELGLRD